MSKYSVVLGITGGIAAYKSVEVVSKLRKLNCDINVILSKNAAEFVTPLTLETISNNPVVTNMFDRETPWEVEHISLADKAQLFVIAPATANIIGKIANGIADDMLSTTKVYLHSTFSKSSSTGGLIILTLLLYLINLTLS